MALIRETRTECDLGQAESVICPQEMLCSFNPACDYKLVRRQPGSCFKLPSEVIGAEMNNRRHFLQRWTALEVFNYVLNDHAKLVAWKCTVHQRIVPAVTRNMTNQVNGQDIGE